MNIEQALALADSLVFTQTGKHLTTLQVSVFRGAWLDQKYDQIANDNYCSEAHIKMLGSALWETLSQALGEKVSKKNLRAVLERQGNTPVVVSPPLNTEPVTKAFICHSDRHYDQKIAQTFAQALQSAGYETILAFEPNANHHWLQRLQGALRECSYFFILLSSQSAVSEIVTEMVKKARHSQELNPDCPLKMIPVKVDNYQTFLLNHDLRGYLEGLSTYEWRSPLDTMNLLQTIGNLKPITIPEIPETLSVKINVPFTSEPPPLPVAEPELPEGQVEISSSFYIERPPIETRCYETILKPGALIRIKAPRQMGKTSLLARILHQANLQGCRSVSLSFQLADSRIFQDLDLLLRWLSAVIGLKLGLPNRLDDYWDEIFGSKTSCQAYFEDYLLAQLDTPSSWLG